MDYHGNKIKIKESVRVQESMVDFNLYKFVLGGGE